MTLAAITQMLRKRLVEYMFDNKRTQRIQPAINIIEIALCIAELGIEKQRQIAPEEEHWFNESWDIIKTLEKTDWEDIIDLYRNLEFKVKERNWFR